MPTIQLLTAATATNSAPSGATAGVETNGLKVGSENVPDEATLLVKSTAGSGVMTVTIRMWGYHATAAVWFPLGVGTDAAKGTINEGSALGETASNTIAHAERFLVPGHFSRLYAEITAIGGTATAISVYVTTEDVAAG